MSVAPRSERCKNLSKSTDRVRAGNLGVAAPCGLVSEYSKSFRCLG